LAFDGLLSHGLGVAKPLRCEFPGGWYHVTARGNERKDIFRDHRDREHFIDLLAELKGRYGLEVAGGGVEV
jgi:putative transposase